MKEIKLQFVFIQGAFFGMALATLVFGFKRPLGWAALEAFGVLHLLYVIAKAGGLFLYARYLRYMTGGSAALI